MSANAVVAELNRRITAASERVVQEKNAFERLVLQRITALVRAVVPGAATLRYSWEVDQGGFVPNALGVDDESGDELLDLADTELEEELRGDLEALFYLDPGSYADGSQIVLEAPEAMLEVISVREARERLSRAESAFAEHGGRGVALADEIDRLRWALTLVSDDSAESNLLGERLFKGSGRVVRNPYLPNSPEKHYLYELLADVLSDVFDSAISTGIDPVAAVRSALDDVVGVVADIRSHLDARFRLLLVDDELGEATCRRCGRPAGADYHVAGVMPEGENPIVCDDCWDERLR